MADEAFPNSEKLLQEAFASADPVPPLLHLIKAHPTYLAVRDLVIEYTNAIEGDPHRGPTLASALVKLAKSPDAPTFQSDTLWSFIDNELAERYFKLGGYNPDDVNKYGPENPHLLDSLISGLSLKHGWSSTKDQYALLRGGLDAPSSSDGSEVLVVGACIQLLLNGSSFVGEKAGSYKMTPEAIADKLKKQKQAGSVKDKNAAKVLEMAIANAEAGLNPENDREDVWALLFP
ncbi:hypothetical protein CPB83DRAFT_860933 [Crepidotus variabilis]|uniref:Uncharacterized protein n=1 Tax=Crepidotus variabilis TaxID=179855 RepID=A0A9P6JL71_9AGAR|nr:hypothetical protein CPB83DRAFT_860933 [Crepidotus variabilis]